MEQPWFRLLWENLACYGWYYSHSYLLDLVELDVFGRHGDIMLLRNKETILNLIMPCLFVSDAEVLVPVWSVFL